MTSGFADVDGLLLDIDGVLAVSWQPIAGSVTAMRWIRERGLPFRLITNTTTHTRADLAATLGSAGFDVRPEEIVTAVVATVTYLGAEHPGAAVYVLSDGDAREDLEGLHLVDDPDGADVIVVGGACDDFTYDTLNRCFRRVMDGASLVGMHRNLYWRTADGWQLDGGAFLAGLEEAAGIRAAVCGKPAPAYFASVLELLGVGADRALMVGDDIVNDVNGAQAAGIRGVLVRTGKFQPSDLRKGSPDAVVDALDALPGDPRRLISMANSSDRSQAPEIFAGIAPQYSWMGAVWSFGQDGRWRRTMVAKVEAGPGARVLDVAAGTGLVSRELAARTAARVIALDPSASMLRSGRTENERADLNGQIAPVLGRAEAIPFPDDTFDAVTFTYLLRYVDDPPAVVRELVRVLKPGGTLASLEFHEPDDPLLRAGWRAYTRAILPAVGAIVSPAWYRTGVFLGPSIERFVARAPLPEQVRWWQDAGVRHVRTRLMSLGAGVVIWGAKDGTGVL